MTPIVLALSLSIITPMVPADGIADDAALLSVQEHADLAGRIAAQRAADGTAIYIETLRNSDAETPRSLALRTLQSWGAPGHSALLLVVMDQRKIWIQPGADLADTFSAGVSESIARDTIAPRLRSGHAGEALQRGVESMQAQLHAPSATALSAASVVVYTQAPSVPAQTDVPSDSHWMLWSIAFACVLAIGWVAIAAWRRRRTWTEPDLDDAEDAWAPPVAPVQTVPSATSMGAASSPAPLEPNPPVVASWQRPALAQPEPCRGRVASYQQSVFAPISVTVDNAPLPAPEPVRSRSGWSDSSPSTSNDSGSSSSTSFDSGGGSSWDSGGGGGGFDSGGGGGGFDSGGGGSGF